MGRLLDEDEVIKIIDKYFDADECNGSDVAMDIMADISCLPSAQPDIIYCEDCKNAEERGCALFCRFWTRYTAHKGYCFKAERREE